MGFEEPTTCSLLAAPLNGAIDTPRILNIAELTVSEELLFVICTFACTVPTLPGDRIGSRVTTGALKVTATVMVSVPWVEQILVTLVAVKVPVQTGVMEIGPLAVAVVTCVRS